MTAPSEPTQASSTDGKSGLIEQAKDWIDYRMPIFTFMEHELHEYPTPKNLNYWWNFGSLAGIVLVIMIATGIVLAMNYTPHVDHAFNSIERIMRDVNYGWLIRYVHMNGGSMFFLVVYIHIFRGLYFGSYKPPRELLWWLGIVILLLMMMTAFMGYVLPWGQMSFWGATVITNLFSAIPWIGDAIVTWLWGGFSLGNPTLQRFFSLHYLLPFVIVGVVVLHLWALHVHGSNNPLGIDRKSEKDSIPFHPYYTIKDLYGLGVFLIFYMAIVFFAPNALGEPDNYIPANPLVTPAHIVPEWYLLPYYAAVLRDPAFHHLRHLVPRSQAARCDRNVCIDLHTVLVAVAGQFEGAICPVPADLQANVLGFSGRLHPARHGRGACAQRQGLPRGGLLRIRPTRSDLYGLLFLPLLGVDAVARQV
jgi:ubiquinol-cytochrome c reductase cytochrome b subunit